MRKALLPLIASLAVTLPASTSASSDAMPALYKKCANLNAKYQHGVGRANARDKTTGTPVTNFKRSNALYKTATDWNKGLDRDKDFIACEKA